MPRFTTTANVDVFDGVSWTLALQGALEFLVQEAVRAFALAVAKRIPVRTGFLRGSLQNLAESTTQPFAMPTIIPVNNKPEYYYAVRGSRLRVLKTPQSGRNFSTPPADILSRAKRDALGRIGSDVARETVRATGSYTFDFKVLIKYLDINDQKHNWGSWEAGIKAFNRVLNAGLAVAIPDFAKFLITERIILSGETIRRSRKEG